MQSKFKQKCKGKFGLVINLKNAKDTWYGDWKGPQETFGFPEEVFRKPLICG